MVRGRARFDSLIAPPNQIRPPITSATGGQQQNEIDFNLGKYRK